jgi:hypothetical protein
MTMGASLYIMDKMKRLLFVFIAIMFLANSFAVSSWAKPCANMSMSDMPCHEQQDESSPVAPCDGLCLCFHVSANQTPILDDFVRVEAFIGRADVFVNVDEFGPSMIMAPPRRPPKNIS